jgi:hypothetical protein
MKDEFGNEAYYDFKNLLMENGAYTFGPDLGIEGYGNNKAYFLEEFNLGYGVTIDPEFCFDTSILKSYSVRGNRVL